jgi:hydroxymethylglutaryl-CoA lyase
VITGTGTRGPVEIVEVSPRDGLQNEPTVLATEHKLRLVADVVAAGARRVEVTSFVRPDLVPQTADAEELVARLDRLPEVAFSGLVLNRRGAERAAGMGLDELNYIVPATDEFSTRNQRVPTVDALRRLEDVARVAQAGGTRLSVTVAVAFGCPYTGDVSADRVVAVCRDVLGSAPVTELALADTIGCGVPGQVEDRFAAVGMLSDVTLRAHFHDTRRTAIANARAALVAGATVLDASIAGLGGCPFAPNAAGNVATEDLAWTLSREGYETGIDVSALLVAGTRVCEHLGAAPRSGVGRAGAFP